ncbi:hypothetical protein N7488_002385 [Penicillium malachiteum]|nr:hypothetical protein N7488_002385 [Penicillium malachiteum]
MSGTIGIFPASGGIGGSTVKHLLPRYPAQSLVFIARNTAPLEFAVEAGACVRQANYDEEKTLENAFVGIDTLFLISYASIEVEYRAERHRTVIDNAIRSGVKYIFYGSLGFAGSEARKETVAHVMKAHLQTEAYLDQCHHNNPEFAYTIIREGLYSESYPVYTAFFDPSNPVDTIKIPHDGSGPGISWVKREELGEGTAELLRMFAVDPANFKYRQQTVLLSGTKALTLQETVEILAKIAKTPLKIRQVSDKEFAEQPFVSSNFIYHGVNYAEPWATSFEAIRRGEASTISPLLGELLGREPEAFETTISR